MSRSIVGLAVVVLSGVGLSAEAARPLTNVVPQETAQRFGLERAWATHIDLDRSRGRVVGIRLEAGLILAQTNQAMVHVLDAESRETLWISRVGRPGAVTTAPAANDKYVTSTNGGEVYLFDRRTGRVLWVRKLQSVPIAGPAISGDRVYVPLVSGMVSSFRLPKPGLDETPGEQALRDNALNYTGKGVTFSPPIVTKYNVAWGTDAGNVYGVTTDQMLAIFRFKARGAVTGLMYRSPHIYAASRDGYVYALREAKGTARWQFSIGSPISETPMATEDGVYAIPETGGLYKLDPATGEELWMVRGIFQFVSASPNRLYTADSSGRLVILDAKSGRRVGIISTETLDIKLFNRDNDRIYLATSTGLIQCLHEIGMKEPAWHSASPFQAAEDGEEMAKGEEGEEVKDKKPAADEGADPFGVEDKMKDDDAMEDDMEEK